MEAFNTFVDILAGAIPLQAPAAVLISMLIDLAKSWGWVKAPESGAFLTGPRLNLLLNGLVFVVLAGAQATGTEAKALEIIALLTQLLPLVVTFAGAVGLSALVHAGAKGAGVAPAAGGS